jgi:amino acid adenylation domain-containing protein
MADLAGQLAALSEERRVLLAHWVARHRPAAGPPAGQPAGAAPAAEVQVAAAGGQHASAAAAGGGQRLVAYVVTGAAGEPSTTELRRFLGERLPEYMVPAAFVALPELPLTPSGKIDRRSLPAPGSVRAGRGTPHAALETPLEVALAEVWQQVLGIEHIGAEDNYFELGGDSIRSIQMLAVARDHGIDLSLQELTRHPTVRGLARAMGSAGADAGAPRGDRGFELLAAADRARLPADVEDAYPLAQLQIAMLLAGERRPEAAAYHDVLTYELRAPLDVDRLRQALAQVIAAHPVLRGSLHLDGFDEPLMLVHRSVEPPLTVEDLRRLSAAAQAAAITAFRSAEVRRSFDPRRAPLFRFRLQIRGTGVFALHWTCHHAILDGWSGASLLAELLRRYLRLLGISHAEVAPPPALAFRELVRLERAAAVSAEAQRFWHERLAGSILLRLPRWPRSAGQAAERSLPFDLSVPAATEQGLRAVARRLGLPLKSVLLGAHLRVLGMLGAEIDVTTGLVVNGRPEVADGERVLGMFLNTVPLRVGLGGGTWVELVRAAFDAEQELLPFRRLPLAQMQRQHRGGEALFETAFNFADFRVVGDLLGVDGVELLGASYYAHTELTLGASFTHDPATTALRLRLDVDAAEIPAAQAEAILGYYSRALAALASEPLLPYQDAVLLAESERHQLLVELNDTGGAEPSPPPFHRLFAAQAAHTPDAVAAVLGGRRLLYGELEAGANRLAWRLRQLGAGAETRIGLLLPRSLDMLVGWLGILKAGCTYLPLDPAYPRDRLAFLLADAGAALILTHAALAGALPADHPPLLLLDAPDAALAACRSTDPEVDVHPGSLAYLIYTSGSAGLPKGVMVSHRALAHLAEAQHRDYAIGPAGRALQMLSLCFDGSLFELCLPLAVGATLVMAGAAETVPGAELTALLRDAAVTHASLPPSMLQVLPAEELPALRTLIVAGEACAADLAARWTPGRRFFNGYGTTETGVWATVSESRDGRPPDIGLPVTGSSAHVLDRWWQPLPVGVAGELAIGGTGLARGYCRQPAATAARFIPDPFSPTAGARLYRTGDLVRRQLGGGLEFLGRIDKQVKLRGMRIEPAEIEAALRRHAAVADAAVVLAPGSGDERFLAAYCVPRAGAVPAAAELRDALRQLLPAHLVPSRFIFLAGLPLTPHGKLDVRALPPPDADPADPARLAAPRTPTEARLAGLWAEALEREQVGVDEDFFLAGGHSLLASRVVARVRQAFGVELPLQALFDAPTVAGLAVIVDRTLALPADNGAAPPLARRPPGAEPPLSFAQQRLWYLDRLQPGDPAYHVPSVLRLSGELDERALARALTEIERRHEVLRTLYAERDGEPVQVIGPPRTRELPGVELGGLPPARREPEARRLAAAWLLQPFDLARGPLWRAACVRLAPSLRLVVLAVHHIAADGWSMGVLMREIAVLYEAFAGGCPSPLAPLPIQYADFAVWQRSWQAGAVLEAGLTYWHERLADAPEVIDLPVDRPRTAAMTSAAGGVPLSLDAAVIRELRRVGRGAGTTPFMELLAGLQVLLHRFCGQPDVVVGAPLAGRRHLETEGLIGCFLNILPLRADLSGRPSFRRLLERTRTTALSDFGHQDVPFEKIVESLRLERDLGRTPLFQVLLALQNVPLPEQRLGGLGVAPVAVDAGATPFDLTLSLLEAGDGYEGILAYRSDLFDTATARRLGLSFERLLAAAAAQAEVPIGELALLDETERGQVLGSWALRPVDLGLPACAHQLFEAWAATDPAAPAIRCGGTASSYGEVERLAERLAGRLRRLGLGAEARVGLFLERSPQVPIAVLGVLKAGAAFLLLDPAYPAERVALMLADSRAPLVVTERRLLAALPAPGPATLCMDTDDAADAAAPAAGAAAGGAVSPRHLAYIVYTSGSTGEPRGVEVEHAALTNALRARQLACPLRPGDRLLQTASLAFDIAIFEQLWPLTAGACVVPYRGAAADGAAIAAAARDEEVTVLHFATPLGRLVYETKAIESCITVRWTLTGGEPLDRALRERILAALPGGELLHLYGPCECAIESTTWHCRRGEPREVTPIGRPAANQEVYVLDAELQPLPAGVPGEICIGGLGLARGYAGRSSSTAGAFIPHPWGLPGARLYRTGDRGRWLADGVLDFLGRLDRQVKVRGQRVELREIEAALVAHPSVRQAVASALRDRAGELRLAVHFVASGAAPPATAELRDFLARRLPSAMVPSAFVAVAAIPLTASGKIDRRALPPPDWGAPGRHRGYAPARTPLEAALVAIWEQVLGVETVGIHDDFFELGGHSLLAARIASRVSTTVGAELPLRVLFEAPTVAGIEAWCERLAGAPAGVMLPPIEPAPRSGRMPLSFAQQRLWFLDRLQPGSSTYNVPSALRLHGPLRRSLLARAFSDLARRHETLRTTVEGGDGEPRQVIHPPAPVPLPAIDLAALGPAVREAVARRLAAGELRRPFDLARGPLLRAALLRLGPEEHVLLLTQHHIVTDGWSGWVLIRELATLYTAGAAGLPSPLPELPIQYADFAVWQRRWLPPVLEAQLAFWRESLAGAPAALELPGDRPRPLVQTSHGGREVWSPPATLLGSLQQLGRGRGVTLYITLLAGFAALLSRYAAQEDVVIGSPVAGRTRTETEGLIGFFVNLLVMRVQAAGGSSFGELLERTRQTTLAAFAHQEVPFEMLVEDLQPRRDLGRTPLFQVVLVLQSSPGETFAAPGLRCEPVELDSGEAEFDLVLSLAESGTGLEGWLKYNRDLFDAATMRRLGGHLQVLLAAAAAAPERRLAELPLLTAAERQQLREWNAAPAVRVAPAAVYQEIEAQTDRTPEQVALVMDGSTLSYRELDRRANRLAHALRARGVGPEVRVGVCVERSFDLVVALLGVAKAGGAYVPLDPSYPPERLAFMLADSQAQVVVVQPDLRQALPALDDAAALVLDSGADTGDGPDGRPRPRLPLDCPVYVIYTSGSTGQPKGVIVTHRGLAHHLAWMQEAFGFTAEDRLLQKTPFGFDASVWEIFSPLRVGAQVVLAAPGDHRDPDRLAAAVERHAISILQLVPGQLGALLEVPGFTRCRSLRWISCGGEALPAELASRCRRRSAAQLMNLYGPTECTVEVSWWRCRPEETRAAVPIGHAMATAEIHLLDRALRPVPVGVAGEVHIGGIQVGRGYWDRPDLTAERFTPDPFSSRPGGRLYRTGDLARRLPGGEMEFLHRLDSQVKLRGFRIELGEIEHELLRHPGVSAAVAVVHEEAPGDERLVAYFVPAAAGAAVGPAPDPGALRRHLGSRLPSHMVPAAFVKLDALPLLPNGKLDRRALPVPDWEAASGTRRRRRRDQAFTAPRTPTEEILAALFADVLKLPRVGVDSSFFALGGHSLLATQLASRIRSAFHVELPLRLIFEAPTVSALAREVTAAGAAAPCGVPPPLLPAPGDATLPLSFAQERLWFIDQLQPHSAAYNVAAALRLTGQLQIPALRWAIGEIVRRHAVLRTSFGSRDGTAYQAIAPFRGAALPVLDLAGLPPAALQAETGRLLAAQARRPFDLALGPPLRLTLLRCAARDHVLAFTVHHVATDGWSTGIFGRELAALYTAALAGEPSPLPELAIQYADFAIWQRSWLRGPVLTALAAYWLDRLDGLEPLSLPADRPRGAGAARGGATLALELPGGLAGALGALALHSGSTLFMVALAAWAALLHRYTGRDDLAVGSPIAGRNRQEIEPLIGFFVNLLVLRADLGGEPTFATLLARLRDSVLGAYAHQDLPFELLVQQARPDRDLGTSPLFQAALFFQARDGEAPALPQLELAWLEVETGAAKFDLALHLAAADGQLVGMLEYDSCLFDAATMRRLGGHLQVLLAAAAAAPERRLAELPLLTAAERQQLREWNAAPAVRVAPAAVYQEIEAQTDRTPERVALVMDGSTLSYRELDRRANRLAHALRARGVGPETRVGVCVERSFDLVVALLGVAKAGGAYVPLDPSYPPERLAFMLADSRAQVVVVQPDLRQALPALDDAAALVLDSGADTGDGPDGRPRPRLPLDCPVYALYTSGSTGQPKGVIVTHRGLAHHLAWMQEAFGFTAEDRLLQKTPFGFDASVWEIFSPLRVGAQVVLAAPGDHRDPDRLAAAVERHAISILQLVPGQLGALLEVPGFTRCRSLRWVACGGEALTAAVARRLSSAIGARLVNLYGPTECTIQVAWWRQQPVEPRLGVPIGHAVPHVEIHLVDASSCEVPAGVAGEVQVGGVQLARGYLERPDLTAERFVPDPFSAEPGARLYRTGDLARRLAGGELEFLGRFDSQRKLRGSRIELGEIEARLLQQPGIAAAAAVIREDVPGDQRLVAYVVPASGSPGESAATVSPDLEALRQALAQWLPQTMVPSAIVQLERLPTLRSGKVDRRALPAPAGNPAGNGAYLAPRDHVELRLARLWEEILGHQPIGIRDDFFAAGGHSLLAVHLVARIEGIWGRRLPVASLFQHGTVEEIAGFLQGAAAAHQPGRALVPIQARGEGNPLFFVHGAGGTVFSYLDLARRLGAGRPFYGLQAAGLDGGCDDDAAPPASVEDMAGAYLREVTAVRPAGPYLLGGWSLGGVIAFEMASQLLARGERVGLLALVDSPLPGGAAAAAPAGDDPWLLAAFARHLGLEAADSEAAVRELASLAPAERLAGVLAAARQAGALPASFEVDSLGRLVDVFRTGIQAFATYAPKPYAGRITYLQAATATGRDGEGWGRLAAGGVEALTVPGDHFTLLREPNAGALAERLRERLAAS